MKKTHILQVLGKDVAKSLVKQATDKVRQALTGDKSLSPKATEIRDICIQASGYGVHMAKAFSIILGEHIDLESVTRRVPFVLWAAIIPLTAHGGHNYEAGSIMILQINDKNGYFRGFRQDGGLGNHVTAVQSNVRVATDEEIDRFIDHLYDMLDTDC